ncbi:hypothetical protein Hamer_G023531 [Homarus americanus]|uniref:Uncharacterized protein n=1 Tax=Homarus americanus TaxID=6706 RepID=A0A8J5MYK2_HOMAM|nr:hypothetical protein Hamer_G023531 [Homarus americanus]
MLVLMPGDAAVSWENKGYPPVIKPSYTLIKMTTTATATGTRNIAAPCEFSSEIPTTTTQVESSRSVIVDFVRSRFTRSRPRLNVPVDSIRQTMIHAGCRCRYCSTAVWYDPCECEEIFFCGRLRI